MAMWRCPHCGTPQAETARCWVCRRSSTSCGTCRHFRASVAAKMGYCGLDRQRAPLSGDEIRSCWESGPGSAEVSAGQAARSPAPESVRTPVPRRDFIEVLSSTRPAAQRPAAERPAAQRLEDRDDLPNQVEPAPAAIAPRWSLWEDADV